MEQKASKHCLHQLYFTILICRLLYVCIGYCTILIYGLLHVYIGHCINLRTVLCYRLATNDACRMPIRLIACVLRNMCMPDKHWKAQLVDKWGGLIQSLHS